MKKFDCVFGCLVSGKIDEPVSLLSGQRDEFREFAECEYSNANFDQRDEGIPPRENIVHRFMLTQ